MRQLLWLSWQSGRFKTPEVRGLSPVMSEVLFIYSLSTVLKRIILKEKEARNDPFFQNVAK